MTRKPAKTTADYLAIAVCPALIMVLVGSLVFFLLQIGYSGKWTGRLQWVLFWFVFAMVLVSRIAIEQSSGAAFLYGLALAAATSLLLLMYVGFIWGVWLLLALIWWVSSKMVWDCTLIDDDQDASGQGLLQASRLNRWTHRPISHVRAVPASELERGPAAHSDQPRTPGTEPNWRPLGTPPSAIHGSGVRAGRTTPPQKPTTSTARKLAEAQQKQDVHNPGSWVLYFSFAAVPVFGLGELFLTSDDTAGRRYGFLLLTAYLTAALGLLLLTSFLGLRRYLRQRYLQMPVAIAGQWLTTGVTLAVGVLLLAVLLPRPTTPYSLASWVTKLGSPSQNSSASAPPSSPGAEGKSSAQAPADRVPQPSDASAAQAREVSQPNATRDQAAGPPPANASGSLPTASSQRQPRVPLPIRFEKWLSYLLLVIVLIIFVPRFWPQISALFKSLLSLLAGLFGGSSTGPTQPRLQRRIPTVESKAQPARLLPNPFQSGQADQMTLAELIQYSFEGLTVWAEARGFHLNESETALEFAERLSQREPVLTREILQVSSYYSHVAYGNHIPPEDSRDVLKSLWFTIGFENQAPHASSP